MLALPNIVVLPSHIYRAHRLQKRRVLCSSKSPSVHAARWRAAQHFIGSWQPSKQLAARLKARGALLADFAPARFL